MQILINSDLETITIEENGQSRELELYSNEAFEYLSKQWLKVGWNQKYVYTFSWLGRPIIQLPEDMIRIQEVIYKIQPDVIMETGVAHGGSLIYYAGLCKIIGKGRVIGVDIEIRPLNRQAIESHFLYPFITLIEGDAIASDIINLVKSLIKPGEKTLVILDSNHSKQHVFSELEAYCDLVSPGSYIVATDGIMKDLYDVPRGKPEWLWDNPFEAAHEFTKKHPEFEIEQPSWLFNESQLTDNITHWPSAWIRRKII